MYYFLFLAIILLLFLKIDSKFKGRIVALVLGLLACLRFGVGADYFSYSYLYSLTPGDSLIKALSTDFDLEVGFKFLMYMFRSIHLPFEVFIAALAIVMMILIALWIEDNSDHILESYLVFFSLFYFVWIFSALRQGLVLVLGLYLLMNRRISLNLWQKIVVILLLSLIHRTALVYFVFILFEYLNVDRRKMTYLILFSFLVSMIAIPELTQWLVKIPILSRIGSYLGADATSWGFWDSKSIPRVFLILIILLHYDPLVSKAKIQPRIINAYLLGLSLYFFLRFDVLVGSRVAIYGYFLAVIIFPALLHLYSTKRRLMIFAFLAFLAFNSLYFMKEISTMASQSGVQFEGRIIPYTSLFQRNELEFTSENFYASNYRNIFDSRVCRSDVDQFFASNPMQSSTLDDPQRYLQVRFQNGKIGLIDIEGKVVLDGMFDRAEYHGGIIFDLNESYFNVKGVELDAKVAKEDYEKAKLEDEMNDSVLNNWSRLRRDEMDPNVVSILENESKLRFQNLTNVTPPLYFMTGEFYSNDYAKVYRIYSQSLVLQNERFYISMPRIISQRIVVFQTVCGQSYFDENGKILWMEEHP